MTGGASVVVVGGAVVVVVVDVVVGAAVVVAGSASAPLQAAAIKASAQISVVRVGRTGSDVNPARVLCGNRRTGMQGRQLATHCREI